MRPSARHIVHYSSGITSWAAAARVVSRHRSGSCALLFADTLIEDGDNYRFLVQSAADVFGMSLASVEDLTGLASDLTPLRGGTDAERGDGCDPEK